MDYNMRKFEVMGEREISLDNMHPSRIFHHINDEVPNSKEYIYLIAGRFGATGKTWLCEGLKQHGYNAIEITEDVCEYVIYRDNKNHYYINPTKKLVIVILNEWLK